MIILAKLTNLSVFLKNIPRSIDIPVEKQINDTKLRYAVGKIDDDIYQVAIDELQERKDKIRIK